MTKTDPIDLIIKSRELVASILDPIRTAYIAKHAKELIMSPDILKAENEVRKEIAKIDKQLSDYLITDASFWNRTGRALSDIIVKVAEIALIKEKLEEDELKAKDENNA